jgi:DnaJ-class molecular chaperone
MSVKWTCFDCDQERTCDPLCGDDWGGVERVVGPDCPECECEMTYLGEVCFECRGTGKTERDPSGAFAMECPVCNGNGYISYSSG